MTQGEHGRQVRKTRAALLGAFNELVLQRRYADIRVGDILRRADVGRSTFYEHFRDKDDLLRASLRGILGILADAVEEQADGHRLELVLEHFRDNSWLARGLLDGPSSAEVLAVLAGLIEERLAAWRQKTGAAPLIPLDLAAAQAAAAQLALVRAWLDRGASCPAAAIAAALHRGAIGSTRGLFSPPAASPAARHSG
jgi:AcrR family transcriptional regulator